jgi:hypothetical protein
MIPLKSSQSSGSQGEGPDLLSIDPALSVFEDAT